MFEHILNNITVLFKVILSYVLNSVLPSWHAIHMATRLAPLIV